MKRRYHEKPMTWFFKNGMEQQVDKSLKWKQLKIIFDQF